MVWTIILETSPDGSQLDIRCFGGVGESLLERIQAEAPGAESEGRTT